MNVMSKLADRDYEILRFIREYSEKHGYAPTYDEIGEAVGLYSKSSVRNHIQKLLETGKIETDHPGSSRAIRIKKIIYKNYSKKHSEKF